MKMFFLILLFPIMSFANSFVVESNSSSVILTAGSTFAGPGFECYKYSSIIPSVKTDQAGTLYVEFSTDATTWDSSLSFSVLAATNEVHRLSVSKKFCRVRFTNTASSDQTYFRLQTLLGDQPVFTSALNASTAQDSDAIVTKSVTEEILIAEGKFNGYGITNKFGTNPDIDTNTVPEDVWENGGTYTGWAAAAENLMVVSTSAADASAGTGARTGTVICLDSTYTQVTVSFTLNGTTPVNTGSSVIRCHTASISTAGSGGVNAGALSFYQQTTTANIFLSMTAGRNQTNCSCYTVPALKKAYMRKLHGSVAGTTSISLDGNIWTRAFGSVFRSRRPFTFSNAFPLNDTIFGGLVFTEKSDIIIRMTSTTANNAVVNAGYDLVVVDQ
jgi:hypothetical protein